MTQRDFLQSFVAVLAESLQSDVPVRLPGIGTWTIGDGETRRIRFEAEKWTRVDTPDDDDFAAALAGYAGRDEDDARRALRSFAGVIHRRIRDTGEVIIPGLGRLAPGELGTVFEPSPEFAETVDWQDAPASLDERPSDAPLPADPHAEDWVDLADVPDTPFLPDDPDPAAGDDFESAVSPYSPAAPSAAEPHAPVVESAVASADRTPRTRLTRRRGSNLSRVLLAIVGGIAVIALVLFVRQQMNSSTQTVVDNPPQPVPADTVGAEPDSSGLALAAADSLIMDSDQATEQPSSAANNSPVSEPVREPATPSAASATFDTTSPGYTIVIGSTTSRRRADALATEYADLGHPVVVLAYAEGAA